MDGQRGGGGTVGQFLLADNYWLIVIWHIIKFYPTGQLLTTLQKFEMADL